MNMRIAAIVIALALSGLIITAQDKKPQGLIKETGQRISLTNGNELYGWCRIAQKAFTPDGQGNMKFSGSDDEDRAATSCMAYIKGVVDSTPVGSEFSPGSDIRVSQYIDTVTEYLKDHASIRNQPAAWLVQNAIREAFPRR